MSKDFSYYRPPSKQEYMSKDFSYYRPPSKQEYKIDNTNLNIEMSNKINSGNITDILSFFDNSFNNNFRDKENNTPVHLIVSNDKLSENQKIKLIENLHRYNNLSIDGINNKNETPLHLAIRLQFADIVKLLLDKGANPNICNYNYHNSLHLALIPNIVEYNKDLEPEPIIDVKTNQNVLYTEIYEKLKDNEDLKLYYNNLIIYVSKLYSFYKQKYDQNIFLNKTNNNIEELKVKNIKYILEDTKQKIIEYQMNKINDDLSISINHILTRATNQIINEFKNFIRPSLTPTNNINKIYDNYDDKIYDKFKDETYKNIIKKINDFLKFLNKNHNINYDDNDMTALTKINKYIAENIYENKNFKIILNYIIFNPVCKKINQTLRELDRENKLPKLFKDKCESIISDNLVDDYDEEYINYTDENETEDVDGIIIFRKNIQYINFFELELNKSEKDYAYKVSDIIGNQLENLNSIKYPDLTNYMFISEDIGIILLSIVEKILQQDFKNYIYFIADLNEYELIIMSYILNYVKNFNNKAHTIFSLKIYTNIIDLVYINQLKDDFFVLILFLNSYLNSNIKYDDYHRIIDLDRIDTEKPWFIQVIRKNINSTILEALILNKINSDDYKFNINIIDYYNNNIISIISLLNLWISLCNKIYFDDNDDKYKIKYKIEYIKDKNIEIIKDDDEDKYDNMYYKNAYEYKIYNIYGNKLYYDEERSEYYSDEGGVKKYLEDMSIYDENGVLLWLDENAKIKRKLSYNIISASLRLEEKEKVNKYDIYFKYNLMKINERKVYLYNAKNSISNENIHYGIIDKDKTELIKYVDIISNCFDNNIDYMNILKYELIYNLINEIVLIEDTELNRTILIDIYDQIFRNTLDKMLYIISVNILKQYLSTIDSTIKNEISKDVSRLVLTINNISLNLNDSDIDLVKQNLNNDAEEYLKYYPLDFNSLELNKKQIYYNKSSIVKYLIKSKKIDYYKLDIMGLTPIFYIIKAGNYILLKEIIEENFNKILYQIYKKKSIMYYAFELFKDIFNSKPNFEDIRENFIKKLIKNGEIKRNIPKIISNSKFHTTIIDYIDGTVGLNFKNISEAIELYITNYENEKNIEKLNTLIINSSEIISHEINIDKIIVIINNLKEYHDIFDDDNLIINTSKININNLLTKFYISIIKKQIKNEEEYNYDEYNPDIDKLITTYIEENITNMINKYYNIKIDNKNGVDEFFNNLLEYLCNNGIVIPESQLYNYIKNEINNYMIELINELLEYNHIIIDRYGSWIINLYNRLETFRLLLPKRN
jgi:hypothetical protein